MTNVASNTPAAKPETAETSQIVLKEISAKRGKFEQDFSARRRLLAEDQAQERALAGARRPDHRQEGAGRDLEVDALETGFTHHSHFSARFRRVFGMTPTAARETLTKRRLDQLRTIVTAASG